MAPSLKDIANELNISTAATSRALNDRPGVSDELRARVKETAQQLGYTTPRATPQHRNGTEETVVILYGHLGGNIIHDIQVGTDQTLRSYGYRIQRYVIDPDKEFANERDREAFMERITTAGDIAGIVSCYIRLSDVMISKLQKRNIAVVLLENHTEFGRCVTINQQRASYKAVTHFVEIGRKNIGCILPPEDADHTWTDRLQGYQQALKDKGMNYDPSLIAYAEWVDFSCGSDATKKLLRQSPNVDAILYGSDALAAGGLKALRKANKRIPKDIAIIGFDDDPMCQALTPTLSSIHQPIQRMATTAVNLLLDSIEKDDMSHRAIQLETELTIRDSCR